MKLLSIVVPSFNSQDYLHKCLDTLIPGGPDVEIIVVDDGSKDRTADIARDYIARWPDIVRLEQKPNGGHGSAVNRGVQVATGTYLKVVDSDDWLDGDAYAKVLACLRDQEANNETLDILITNYVYEYAYNGTRNCVNYNNALPQNQLIGWEHLRKFRLSQVLLMHSLIYRTGLLRECKLELPEHTFYVDNIFCYQPLPLAQRVKYLDVDFYRYFIGRADQSVNTSVMIKRIDQQLRVTRLMLHYYHLDKDVADIHLRRYMYSYLSMMVTVSVVHLILSEDEANLRKINELWQEIQEFDLKTYNIIHKSFMNRFLSLPGRGGRYIVRKGFKLARRIYKFS